MKRRVSTLLIFIILIFSFSLSCLAAEPLVTITRPDGDETTFKQSYVICGNTDKEDVTVELAVYDTKAEEYVPLATQDGDEETSFKIGASGIFMKEVGLKEGANKIRVFVYTGTDREHGETYNFTITLLQEDKKDKIKGGLLTIEEVLKNVFPKDELQDKSVGIDINIDKDKDKSQNKDIENDKDINQDLDKDKKNSATN